MAAIYLNGIYAPATGDLVSKVVLGDCCCSGTGACSENFHCSDLNSVEITKIEYKSCSCYHDHCIYRCGCAFREGFVRGSNCGSSTTPCHNGGQSSGLTVTWNVPGDTSWHTLSNESGTYPSASSSTCSSVGGTTMAVSARYPYVIMFCTGSGWILFDRLSSCSCLGGADAAFRISIRVHAASGRSVTWCFGGSQHTTNAGETGTDTKEFSLAGGRTQIKIPFIIK